MAAGRGGSVKRGLGQKARAQSMRAGEVRRIARQHQPVAQQAAEPIGAKAAGQGPVSQIDGPKQRPLGDPRRTDPGHYRPRGPTLQRQLSPAWGW